jgi:hypothetical protein
MMPGIINPFIFGKKRRLFLRAVPMQYQLAGPKEPLDDGTNRLGIQVRTSNLPRRPRSRLLSLQQTCFD